MPAEPLYPEVTKVRLPAGMLEQVHAAARLEGTSAAELMRRAIREAVLRGLRTENAPEAA